MRWLPLLLILAALAAAATVRNVLGVEWSTASVRDVVLGYGLWAPLVFVLLLGFRQVILIPSQILLVAAGLVFGTAWGTLFGALGIILSGLLTYGLARWLGRDAIRARIPETLHWALDLGDRPAAGALLALGTAYPVGPVTAYHAGAGMTAMGAGLFTMGLAVGATARAALFTYVGSSLAEEGNQQLLLACSVLLLVVVLPALHPRTRAWVRGQWGKSQRP